MKFLINILSSRTLLPSILMAAILMGCLSSCEKYVTIDKAPNQLLVSDVYKSDGTATSAVLGMYSYYYTPSVLNYFTYTGGLEAGELQYYYASSTADLNEFQQSAVSITNSTLANYLWAYPYSIVMQANMAVDGLTASTTLTPSIQSQLLGEAKFFRAYLYFNLVNYFGGVPLSLSSNTLSNASLPRASTDSVYAQIISDLQSAETLLPAAYTGNLRTRPNKYAAAALLARAYLYKKDYPNAEAEASKVIGATDVSYSLAPLSTAFQNSSSEVIFQIGTTYGYSIYGQNYRTSAATGIPNYYLAPGFINAFEPGDSRLTNWVDSVVSGGTAYYRINKYKLYTATAGNEYNIILRLAELYLIRAEARAQQNEISGAQSDLNAIRTRAGLGNTPAAGTTDLLTAVAKERQVELFGESAHRWFDLKRTGTADAVVGALKPGSWKTTAVLLPIPYTQILQNPALTQNLGYGN